MAWENACLNQDIDNNISGLNMFLAENCEFFFGGLRCLGSNVRLIHTLLYAYGNLRAALEHAIHQE